MENWNFKKAATSAVSIYNIMSLASKGRRKFQKSRVKKSERPAENATGGATFGQVL
jgi:hypothetical protein